VYFILIFNETALIFIGGLIAFTVSSFQFQQVRLTWHHRCWWVAPIHPTSVYWIIRFMCNNEVLPHKSEAVPEFKNALQLIWWFWSALPQKGTDSAVKDYSKRLQAVWHPTVDILNI